MDMEITENLRKFGTNEEFVGWRWGCVYAVYDDDKGGECFELG